MKRCRHQRSPGQAYGQPGRLVRSAISVSMRILIRPGIPARIARDGQFFRLAFRNAARLFAAHGANVALQIAHAGFTRVMPADETHRIFRNFNLLFRQTVFFDLLGNQIALSDVGLYRLRCSPEAR